MVTVHRTTQEELAALAVQPEKPRSVYDDLLDNVAQGQLMRIETSDSKEVRAAKVAITRLAKKHNVSITYRPLTNGFAVLLDEPVGKPKATSVRQRRTRQGNDGEATSI